MPSYEKAQKSELLDNVDQFLLEKRKEKQSITNKSEGDVEFLNVIEFIEKFKLLPFGLYPVQKFILKLYYNIPLDSTVKSIKITDKFNTKVLHTLTELEYLDYLFKQGRCNINSQDGKERKELILVLGRRSGKSEISSIVASYEAYKLICRGNPQSYYGMPSSSEFRIMCIANDKDQASIVYSSMQGHVENVDYFKTSQANTTQTYMRFRTAHDKEKHGPSGRSSIVASFKSSVAKGLRGRGIICVVLDEIAFFIDDGKSSAERVYKAIVPSTAQFSPKDPSNKHIPVGPSDGRIILISSPDAKDGFFYHKYQMAMSASKAAGNTLVIQAPTWEVNPTLSSEYYEVEHAKDPAAFMTEHGAEFSDRVRGWIENPVDLTDCIVKDLTPKDRGLPRETHFAGFDLGMGRVSGDGDGSCVAITRLHNGKIELAYHEIWYAGRSWRESNPHLTVPLVPYALTIHEKTRLELTEIVNWIEALSKRFYIHKGVFDQWSGIVLEQEFHKKRLNQFEMRHFTSSESSNMYQTFKMLMLNKQIALYDYPVSVTSGDFDTTKHSPLIAELLELQATSIGKNMVSVEAPRVVGKHDDQSDALARSVLLAAEYIKEKPDALGYSYQNVMNRAHIAKPMMTPQQYQRMKARTTGGTPKYRQAQRIKSR